MGVLHHSAPRGDGRPAHQPGCGQLLAQTVREGEWHRLLDGDPGRGFAVAQRRCEEGVGRLVLLPGPDVGPDLDLLEGPLPLESGGDPGRRALAGKHHPEEALGQAPGGPGEVLEAAARGQHQSLETGLPEEGLGAKDP